MDSYIPLLCCGGGVVILLVIVALFLSGADQDL